MSTIISVIEEIKRNYLNTAANLAILSLELDDLLTLEEASVDARITKELDEFCRLIDADMLRNHARCVAAARLQNKISPPPFVKQKKVIPSYLTLVKSS